VAHQQAKRLTRIQTRVRVNPHEQATGRSLQVQWQVHGEHLHGAIEGHTLRTSDGLATHFRASTELGLTQQEAVGLTPAHVRVLFVFVRACACVCVCACMCVCVCVCVCAYPISYKSNADERRAEKQRQHRGASSGRKTKRSIAGEDPGTAGIERFLFLRGPREEGSSAINTSRTSIIHHHRLKNKLLENKNRKHRCQ